MKCLYTMKSHPIPPRDLRSLGWVGRGSLNWPSLPLHFSVSVRKTGREIHLDPDSHRFSLHREAVQKVSRATFCILQMWFQAFTFFSEASPCVASLAVHHPQTGTPALPAVLLNICRLTGKWPCSCLWNRVASFSRMKKSSLCLTPGWFNLTRYLFFNRYFFSTLEAFTSSWSCTKQHTGQSSLVSLFGLLWEVCTDIFPECPTWVPSHLLVCEALVFPFNPATSSWHYAISVSDIFV